jgi:hybrid cluster-associated redox disulfide protein
MKTRKVKKTRKIEAKKKKKITKEMTFYELMQRNEKAGMKLAEMGMLCGGCAMAQMETLEQGCAAHGVDVNKVLKELNK